MHEYSFGELPHFFLKTNLGRFWLVVLLAMVAVPIGLHVSSRDDYEFEDYADLPHAERVERFKKDLGIIDPVCGPDYEHAGETYEIGEFESKECGYKIVTKQCPAGSQAGSGYSYDYARSYYSVPDTSRLDSQACGASGESTPRCLRAWEHEEIESDLSSMCSETASRPWYPLLRVYKR